MPPASENEVQPAEDLQPIPFEEALAEVEEEHRDIIDALRDL